MPWVFVRIWSTGFIVARYGMPHAPPMSFLWLRFLLSIVCFLVWVRVSKVAWPHNRVQWFHIGMTGLFMHVGYLGGVWTAVKAGMGSGLVALIVGLQPILTALWVSAMLSITVGTLYQKHFVQPCDVRTANAVQLMAAFMVVSPLAFLEAEPMVWNPELIGAMAWSVLAVTLGGSSLLFMLIQRGAATAVTSLLYLVPPTTALMAWVLFDEPVTLYTLLGTALAAWGVSWVVRTPPSRA